MTSVSLTPQPPKGPRRKFVFFSSVGGNRSGHRRQGRGIKEAQTQTSSAAHHNFFLDTGRYCFLNTPTRRCTLVLMVRTARKQKLGHGVPTLQEYTHNLIPTVRTIRTHPHTECRTFWARTKPQIYRIDRIFDGQAIRIQTHPATVL